MKNAAGAGRVPMTAMSRDAAISPANRENNRVEFRRFFPENSRTQIPCTFQGLSP
jgi:hypothetical protein